MSNDWPKALGGNQFSTAKLDPEVPMTLKVQTWSNLGEPGGQVKVGGFLDGKSVYGTDFGSITIHRDGSTAAETAHLQFLVDEFNEDPANNWRAMVVAARAYLAAFYAKQAAEYGQKSADAANGIFS